MIDHLSDAAILRHDSPGGPNDPQHAEAARRELRGDRFLKANRARLTDWLSELLNRGDLALDPQLANGAICVALGAASHPNRRVKCTTIRELSPADDGQEAVYGWSASLSGRRHRVFFTIQHTWSSVDGICLARLAVDIRDVGERTN